MVGLFNTNKNMETHFTAAIVVTIPFLLYFLSSSCPLVSFFNQSNNRTNNNKYSRWMVLNWISYNATVLGSIYPDLLPYLKLLDDMEKQDNLKIRFYITDRCINFIVCLCLSCVYSLTRTLLLVF